MSVFLHLPAGPHHTATRTPTDRRGRHRAHVASGEAEWSMLGSVRKRPGKLHRQHYNE